MKSNALSLALITFLAAALSGCFSEREGGPLTDTGRAYKNSVKYDVLFLNGTIVDGTGSPRYKGDIAVLNGRIAAIGQLERSSAGERVDITGLVLAPGFIDTHSHADIALSDPATAGINGFLTQGVTTALYGVDGSIGIDKLHTYIRLGEANGMGINFMSYIGHNAVRKDVMGMESRPPSFDEMREMKSLINDAMKIGTVGLSTGLMYLPGNYATTEEIIKLAKVTAPYGAVYDSHVRDPVKNLLKSHQECLDIAYAAGVDAHPGHVKAVGARNFGKGPEIVALINAGIARGQNVTVDLYPYDGAATAPIIQLLHSANDKRWQEIQSTQQPGNDATSSQIIDIQNYWRDIIQSPNQLAQAKANTETPPAGIFSWVKTVGYGSMRIVESSNKAYLGRMVTELAAEKQITPFELFRQLVVQDADRVMVTLGAIQEEDIQMIMKQPWAMISSDGGDGDVINHPRSRGTFPRLLGHYVRGLGVLTLEEGVHKISGLPANYLKLDDRGVIKEGNVADITVFDPSTIIDKATWSQPELYSEGIVHVLINGKFALRNGGVSQNRLGRFIPFKSNRGVENESSD